MSKLTLFPNTPAGRLAGLAGALLCAALCWAAVSLLAISRAAQDLDGTLLTDARQRRGLATTVERLARHGETILHAPEKNARQSALAESLQLAAAFNTPDQAEKRDTAALSAAETRGSEILSAVFAQLNDLAANRDEQERLAGLAKKRLAAFDAIINSVVENIPAGSDSWSVVPVLAKLRLELEHTDATAETRRGLLAGELATRAKVLRLEGADSAAALLERVPGRVQELAQLRRRIEAYHRSNHEQWNIAAGLLDQLAQDLAADTPSEQQLGVLRSRADNALRIVLAATALALALGVAALRRARRPANGYAYGGRAVRQPKARGTDALLSPAAPLDANAPPAGAPDLAEPPAQEYAGASPETLLPELRNRFAQSEPAALSLAETLRTLLADGPHKSLADEIYVRAAFGEYGKALESLEKLSSCLRAQG